MKNAVVRRISNILPPPPTHTQKKRVHCGGSSELVMRMKIDTRNKTRKRYQQTKLHFFFFFISWFSFFLVSYLIQNAPHTRRDEQQQHTQKSSKPSKQRDSAAKEICPNTAVHISSHLMRKHRKDSLPTSLCFYNSSIQAWDQ